MVNKEKYFYLDASDNKVYDNDQTYIGNYVPETKKILYLDNDEEISSIYDEEEQQDEVYYDEDNDKFLSVLEYNNDDEETYRNVYENIEKNKRKLPIKGNKIGIFRDDKYELD